MREEESMCRHLHARPHQASPPLESIYRALSYFPNQAQGFRVDYVKGHGKIISRGNFKIAIVL